MNKVIRLKIVKLLSAAIAVIIVLVPFHAFLTVWISSLTGHYTALRLWDEALLLLASLVGLVLLPKVWPKLKRHHLIWLIIAYTVLQVVIGLAALARGDVTAKALGYGLIVNLRFLLFFMLCLIVSYHNDWLKKHWKQLLLIPAGIVIVFGLYQYFVLPYDFLRHFGYGSSTIFPYETINHNIHYIRIISTLRGANPLGAYLVIISATIFTLFIRAKNRDHKIIYGLFAAATFGVLFLSFSRSAWLGAILAVAIVVSVNIKKSYLEKYGPLAIAAIIVIGGLGAIALKNNSHFQNIFTHTQQHSAVKTTSDQGHISALKSGIKDVIHQPLGRGPGTAGPASIYNNVQGRIAENYFIQIAQEVGWLGLIIFLLINFLIAKGLWLNRTDTLSLALFASLIGISLVGLFSHVWVDDTLSYIWWGLAGIALAPALGTYERKTKPTRI